MKKLFNQKKPSYNTDRNQQNVEKDVWMSIYSGLLNYK